MNISCVCVEICLICERGLTAYNAYINLSIQHTYTQSIYVHIYLYTIRYIIFLFLLRVK